VKTRVAVIDYRAGNVTSVGRALERLGARWEITADHARIRAADRVIFPGVGAAFSAMRHLRELGLPAVVKEVVDRGTPFLGICLGAQIIFERSDEGPCECLGLLPGSVVSFPPALSFRGERLKVPHMGWNVISVVRPHPIFAGNGPEDRFYFVHAYVAAPSSEELVLATTDYGIDFPSVVGKDNVVATQFHPEKSGAAGLRLLENFLAGECFRHAG
jgi:imidazole glycerol-phosphate synthase subunit HisH